MVLRLLSSFANRARNLSTKHLFNLKWKNALGIHPAHVFHRADKA